MAVLIARIASIGLGFLLSTVLFRTLGPSRYGLWSLFMLVAGSTTLVDFGLATAVERRVAVLWAQGALPSIGTTVQTITFTLVCGAALAEVVLLVALGAQGGIAGHSELTQGLVVLPISAAVTLASLAFGAVLSGQQRMRTLQMHRTFGLTLACVAVAGLASAGMTRFDVLLLAYTAGTAVTLALVWQAVRTSLPGVRLAVAWDRDVFHELVRFGGVIQLTTAVSLLVEYAFRILIGVRFGLADLGAYDLAARAAISLRSVAGTLFTSMVPFAVQTEQLEGSAGLIRLTRRSFRYVALFILPSTAALLPFSAVLMHMWLGGGAVTDQVARCFQVMLLAHAVAALSAPASMIGRGLGRPGAEAMGTAVSLVAGLVATQFAPTLPAAAATLWGFSAVGGFVVWRWLARVIHIGSVKASDLGPATLLALVVFVTSRAVASAVGSSQSWSILGGLGLVLALGAGLAALSELRDPERRRILSGLFRRPRSPVTPPE